MLKMGLAVCLMSLGAYGYEVSVGTVIASPGGRVSVPVSFDSVRGAANAGVRIAYDPQILKFIRAEKGVLNAALADDFVVSEDAAAGTVAVSAFGTDDVATDVSGSLANLVFDVREGTQGLYSEIAVSDVRLGEKTGVKDIAVGNPVSASGGMVRVMAVNSVDGDAVTTATADRVRTLVSDRLPMAVTSLKVSGPKDKVDAIVALGISPKVSVDGASAVAEYSEPEVRITNFDPQTGLVKIKVTPGEGGRITAEPTVGCIQVYGTDDLARTMELISTKSIDLSEYLQSGTEGEATIAVDLEKSRFVRVGCH